MNKLKIALAATTLTLSLSACHVGAQSSKGFGDSPVGAQHKEAAEVINFSDTYQNIEDKCDGHGHRVYNSHRDSGFFVVVADPTCR